MAQFDVHEVKAGRYLIDCQADLLSHLESRITIPLEPASERPPAATRLHPHFAVQGRTMVLATHLAGAIPTRSLGRKVSSLIEYEYEIKAALDVLISGI